MPWAHMTTYHSATLFLLSDLYFCKWFDSQGILYCINKIDHFEVNARVTKELAFFFSFTTTPKESLKYLACGFMETALKSYFCVFIQRDDTFGIIESPKLLSKQQIFDSFSCEEDTPISFSLALLETVYKERQTL